jgi:hypothetical protein
MKQGSLDDIRAILGNDKAINAYRVVLVNFWTSSCINSLRELP